MEIFKCFREEQHESSALLQRVKPAKLAMACVSSVIRACHKSGSSIEIQKR